MRVVLCAAIAWCVGCAGSSDPKPLKLDGGGDAASDEGNSDPRDAGHDAAASADAGADAAANGGTDASIDASVGPGVDGGPDSGFDSGIDSGTDAGSCTDQCTTLNAKRCAAGNQVERCQAATGGCLDWVVVAQCTAPLDTCSNGDCAAACLDECLGSGTSACLDDGVVSCGNHDADPCLEWSSVTPCDLNESCSSGVCSATCSHECATDSATCDVGGLRSCGNHDADACRDWSDPVACSPIQTCQTDACVPAQPPTVVISELLVNSVGSPDTESFVELHGSANGSVVGLSLVGVAGNTGADYVTVSLTGVFDANGLFVVAHPSASAATLAVADQLSASIDLRNGPDSLQLRWGATVVDAVGYGDFSAATFAGEGDPADVPGVDQSLVRDGSYTDTDDNAADFSVTDLSSPGSVNPAPNLAPEAALSCPNQVYVGQAASFSAVGSSDPDGDDLVYRFSFGDGVSLSSPVPQVGHAYVEADSYQVDLTVEDEAGLTDTASCIVTALVDPCASVSCNSPPPNACVDANTQRAYASSGTCVAGTCQYPHADTVCSTGCNGGSCQAPSCGASTCDSPPADACVSNVLRRYAPTGSCVSNTCTYVYDSIACSNGCFIDACIAGSDQYETPAIGTSTFHDADLKVDALDRPHVAYCTNAGVFYRTRDLGGWRQLTVDAATGGAGCRVSIALDQNGAPHVGYFDPLNQDLRYATIQGNVVTPQLVATQGNVGRGVSLSFTPTNQPQLVYLDGYSQELKLSVRGAGGTWTPSVIDNWTQTSAVMDSQQHWYDGNLQILIGGANDAQPAAFYERIGNLWTTWVTAVGIVSPTGVVREPNGDTHVMVSNRIHSILDGCSVPTSHPAVAGSTAILRSLHLRVGDNLEAFHFNSRRLSTDDRALWPAATGTWPASSNSNIERSFIRNQTEQWALHANLALTTVGVCTPDCMGRVCGDDKCGGSCGSCGAGSSCNPTGQCGPWQYETLYPIVLNAQYDQYNAFVHQGEVQTVMSFLGAGYYWLYTQGGEMHALDLGVPGSTFYDIWQAFDVDGELYFAWAEGSTVQVIPVTSGGAAKTYDLPGDPSRIALGVRNGEIDLFYQLDLVGNPAAFRLYHVHDDGSGPSAPVEVAAQSQIYTIQRVEYDGDGDLHLALVWTGGYGAHASNQTGSWVNSPLVGNITNFKGAVAPNGTYYITYRRQDIGGGYSTFLNTHATDGTLSPQVYLNPTIGTFPIQDLDIMPDGRQLILMTDATRPIYVRTVAGAFTNMTLELGSAETLASWSQIYVSPTGEVSVFYEANIGGPDDKTRRAFRATVP